MELDEKIVDAMAALLVRDPSQFDCIVTGNMFGDILSDEASEISGSLGLAGSVMAGDDACCAQAQHGSAPDIAGQDKANPTSLILSAAMLLEWLAERHQRREFGEAAQAIERAIDRALGSAETRTRDLGGKLGTQGVRDARRGRDRLSMGSPHPLPAPTRFGPREMRVPVATHQMVVHDADCLHEGIYDGRSHELEAAARELARDRSRQLGLRRHLLHAARPVDSRLAVHEVPQEPGETRPLLHHIEPCARGTNRAFDFQAIAYDARVLHQLLDASGRIAGDSGRIESIERAPEVLALAQDDDPGESRLESVEHELLEQGPIVVFRNAPFVVVVGDVERVLAGPRAAGKCVGRFAHLGKQAFRSHSRTASSRRGERCHP